ncbi:hypothetical protein [Ralstonia solanacearum]|uniref:helix-turn-helix domain-containing protein n=1 Tax=Ralstonia solanacearum TaxID=305 RepID=UPI002E2234D7
MEDRIKELEADVGRLRKEASRVQDALAKLVNALLETDANDARTPTAPLTTDELLAQRFSTFLDSTKPAIERTIYGYVQAQLQGTPLPSSRRRTNKGEVQVHEGLATVAGTRDVITTTEAAAVLNFKENTLRKWACHERGPIRPVRINGRLGWRVTDVAALLNGDKL